MKCPKCGYNSFEFHDSCKKCSSDLTGYKETYGLKSIVLPLEARTNMAEALMAEAAQNAPESDASDAHDNMFSFDLPESVAPQTPSDDPFNFDEEPAAPAGGDFSFNDENKGMQTKAEEDAFADLLETTPQKESAVEGSSDLNNFSWDDTPGTSAANPAKPAEDGFDSLFGDTDDSAEK